MDKDRKGNQKQKGHDDDDDDDDCVTAATRNDLVILCYQEIINLISDEST